MEIALMVLFVVAVVAYVKRDAIKEKWNEFRED